MTLDQCFDTYKGTVVLVDGNPADAGQCVQWADVVLAHVYGDVTHYGNAIDWYLDPRELLSEGFERVADGSIKKGDFVVFGTGVGSIYGHIDVAMSDGSKAGGYTGADSNWGHDLTVHAVNHNDYYNQFILGCLRLKESNMTPASQTPVDNPTAALIYNVGLNRDASIQEVTDLVNSKITVEDLLRHVWASPEHIALMQSGVNRDKALAYIQSNLK